MQVKSALSRTIDPKYRTNLLILALTVLMGLIFGLIALLDGKDLLDSATDGFWAGAATMTAWVLGREIDPDHDWAAFVGAVAAPVLLMGASFGLFAVAILILFSRLVARTVGIAPTLFDSIVLIGLVALALFWGNPWVLGLAAALAFILDAMLPPPLTRHYWFAVGALGIALIDALVDGWGSLHLADGNYLIGALAVGIGFLWLMVATDEISAAPDHGKAEHLRGDRVRGAMGVTLIGVILMALWQGNSGIVDMIPAWSAMGGVVLYRLGILIS